MPSGSKAPEPSGTSRANKGKRKPVELDASRPLWVRQRGESIQAYEAFMTYLTLDRNERTVRKTSEVLGKGTSILGTWSAAYSWNLRVSAYEEHYMLLNLESIQAKRDDMFTYQEALAATALSLVQNRLDVMISSLAADYEGPEVDMIKPDALVRLFSEAAKIQRLAVIGRVESLEKLQELQEQAADRWSDELSAIMREVMDDLELNPEEREKFTSVLSRRLLAEAGVES